jgi:hypothetical protein
MFDIDEAKRLADAADKALLYTGAGEVSDLPEQVAASLRDAVGEIERLCVDLQFLRRAICEGDPKPELVIRIDDMLKGDTHYHR